MEDSQSINVNKIIEKVYFITNNKYLEERTLSIIGRKIKILNMENIEICSYNIENIKELILTNSIYNLQFILDNNVSFFIISHNNVKSIIKLLLTKKKNITIDNIKTTNFKKLTKINLYLSNHNKNYFNKNLKNNNSNILNGYKFIKFLDKGAFSKVYLVQKIDDKKSYVLKIIKKKYLENNNEYYIINNEFKVLSNLKNEFLIDLKSSFQDADRIYFVFDYIQGGNLFNLICKNKTINEDFAKFYIANIVIAINFLHSKNYIYKDLKLENILINNDGYLKLIDFGLCQYISKNESCYLFSGTPEYISPEVILMRGHSFAADWWSIGIILYELLHGIPPFYNSQISKMYHKIIKDPVSFNDKIPISDACKDIILKLLKKDPKNRIKSIQEIINHEWFKDFDFNKLLLKQLKPPFEIKNKIQIKDTNKNLIEKFLKSNENKKTQVYQKNFKNSLDFLNKIESI